VSDTQSLEFDSWMSRAGVAMTSNRYVEALESVDQALAIQPQDLNALNAKGVVLGALDRFGDAAESFKRAIAVQPMNPRLHYNLAYALQRQERFIEALASFNAALTLLPGYPEALINRGVTLNALGRYDEAALSMEQAGALCPQDASVAYNLGRIYFNAQNFRGAEQAFEAALRISHDFQEARIELGRCQIRFHELEAAVQNFEIVLARAPTNADAIEGLATALRLLEQYEELLNICRELVARAPNASAPLIELGATLASLNKRTEAEECFGKAVELDPKNPMIHGRIGRARIELGDMDGARAALRAACELQPRSALRWGALTEVTRVAPGDPLFGALQDLLRSCQHTDHHSQARLHFALGKAFSDVDDKDRGFYHYLEGNRFQRKLVQYDEQRMLGAMSRTQELFSPAIVKRCAGHGNNSQLPIFVVGMPRTGSTLVEQILAAHSRVAAIGESTAFQQAISALDLTKASLFPEWLPTLEPDELSKLAQGYLARIQKIAAMRDSSFDPSGRIIDKMLGNFRYVGMVHMALPNARIIHVRRDPVDTCLSCFQNLFDALSLPFTYDLAELGRFYRQYDRLMGCWTAMSPLGAMLTVQYESLVHDLETTARGIISYCGLEWEDACLQFYRSERAVRTVSALQVRRPLYATSIGRWRPSDTVLRPLLDALAAV
jgi:tetratricopeptide (TPR) repeat protein